MTRIEPVSFKVTLAKPANVGRLKPIPAGKAYYIQQVFILPYDHYPSHVHDRPRYEPVSTPRRRHIDASHREYPMAWVVSDPDDIKNEFRAAMLKYTEDKGFESFESAYSYLKDNLLCTNTKP